MKQDITESRFSVDKGCQICHGTGFLPVPDYSLIGQLGAFDRAVAGEWTFVPAKVCYCPICFANEAPTDAKNNQYRNLLQHVAWAMQQSSDYMQLLRSLLLWHWKGYYSHEHALGLVEHYCGVDYDR